MTKKYLFLLGMAFACCLQAAVPPAEKLLPRDTIFLLSTTDAAKLRSTFKNSAHGQFWNDPAMRPFREDFTKKCNGQFMESLDNALGIKVGDYLELAQGQTTVAMTRNGWEGKPDQKLGMLLMLDAKDKSSQLKTNLNGLKQRWESSSQTFKKET